MWTNDISKTCYWPVGYALKSQDWKSEYYRFCGKLYFW
jgi:hypothetical protein